jgi:hypothetical protein
MNAASVIARSAIESLRSGVPSRNAVSQLGTTQYDVRDRFVEAMESIAGGEGASPIVVSATFGAGKTHLLDYLQSLADQEGFVTSFAVISSEMPLGNAHMVVKAITESAHAPGQADKALRALASQVKVDSDSYRDLYDWTGHARLDDRFRALLRLYEAFRADEEFRIEVLNDFEGKPLLKSAIKSRLKQINEVSAYDLTGPRNALLAHDRIRLLSRFFRAGGCKGWVVLFDEMERVAKFSAKQRLAAYAELGWWREAAEMAGSYLLPVFTTASGFVQESVTGGSNDERRIGTTEDRDRLAMHGIEMLKSPFRLESPTPEQEEQIKYRLKSIYEEAYGVPVQDFLARRSDIRISIRSEIRRWITLWDLHRYYPEYHANVAMDEVRFDSSEIADSDLDSEDEE